MSTEPILKFGVPKGSLEEATQDLFARAGWKISRHERNYFPDVNDPELQLSLTRVQEIGGLVADGILDAGIAARGEGNFVVFNGPDEQFVSGRVIGADGGIGGTYAVMPELYLAMNEHINKGEVKEAQALQYEADRIIYKMCEAHGNLYAVQKEILRRMYGLELGGVREPMPSLIPEDEPIVAEAQAMIEVAIAKL